MEAVVLFGALLVAVPFVLPVVVWVMVRNSRERVSALERVVLQQAQDLDRLTARLQGLEQDAGGQQRTAGPEPDREAAEARPSVPLSPAGTGPPPAAAPASEALEPLQPIQPLPPLEPWGPLEPLLPPEPLTASEALPSAAQNHQLARPAERIAATPVGLGVEATVPPIGGVEPAPSPPPPSRPPAPSSPGFDWESLIGVKLFAAIAGIALVVAAVFFLKYSIDEGWLQPPVRAAIGVIVAIALLVICELKSARAYPATANALDGAAIAILFATFFSAHALWNLIPAFTTFLLLAVVTALAVLLSIRRESLFIAVLGLMGGFATPALLSGSENRPVPLFAYLLLLNIGLAWVAYRKTWPVLTWLTLGFTTLYQWNWVMRFLGESSLSLAMGIFLVFPLAAAVALVLGGPRAGESGAASRNFERTAMLSAALPLLFAGYLVSVPAYAAQASLLLGFLLLVDAGLLAIAVARAQPLLHAVGGVATLVVLAVWLSTSYVPGAGWRAALGFTPAFVVLFLAAAPAGRWAGRPFQDGRIALLAPLLLFVFAALAAVEPTFVRPLPLFATLLAVLLAIAWRAVAEPSGSLFYIASFFTIATQAIWSAQYLTGARLRQAVVIYSVFGLVSMATPVLARQAGRALQPSWGSGAVLIASLVLLAFVSLGPVSPAALWALALLLAIMNAGLFVESASGGLPRVSHIGTLLSWGLLGIWWLRSAGSVGVLPSLIVMTGLTLLTLAGHAWASRQRTPAGAADGTDAATFRQGLYLALVGHLFLVLIAGNREWSLPPWPIFGATAVMTLGTSAVSLLTRTSALHAAGVVGAALVVASWAGGAGAPAWGLTVVIAAASVSAFALLWIRVAKGLTTNAAAVVLFVGELAVLSGTQGGARPPFAAELLIHVVDVALILALTTQQQWRLVAVAAVIPAWAAVVQWQQMPAAAGTSGRLFLMSGALYALFVAYPLALGARARANRDPYVAAILASAMFFLAGRQAMEAAGLGWAVGVVPVGVAAVLALLLRSLLSLEPEGQRDIGRLALVAGAALAFVTVAIPLQLQHQWITIGWALEGAAIAWLFSRIPHRGLLYFSTALLAAVFVRLTLNPEILLYEPRGMRIFNWYLYAYLICAAAMFAAAWWMSGTRDRLIAGLPRVSGLLPAAAVIVLFLLLNIEIADYYSTGVTIAFSFGTGVSQDLTYTIGWLVFGILLLAGGIYAGSRPARITAVALMAVTTLKCFLYDLASLQGLYRVGSFVGLALALALVSIALKGYVLSKPKDA